MRTDDGRGAMRLVRVLAAALVLAGPGCRDGSRTTPVVEGPRVPVPVAPVEQPPTAVTPVREDKDQTKPKPTPDGIPGELPGVYEDKGEAAPDAPIRGLISFKIHDEEGLAQALREIYDPAHPRFRKYLTREEWVARHAPPEDDVRVVREYLVSKGLAVPRVASNRLFLQFTGTVKHFNEAFNASVRVLERKSPQVGNEPHDVYGLGEQSNAPKFIRDRIHAVVALDIPPHASERLAPEELDVDAAFPDGDGSSGLTVKQVGRVYGVAPLWERGLSGKGVRLGVVIGAGFRRVDARAFWRAMGVDRPLPRVVTTMEPPVTRYKEGQLDVEWAGAMAPGAELVVYMGTDARNTSMIFTFNEAIARGEVDVITDSFAHREDSEPRTVRQAYSHAAMMAAALGVTVVAAGGDSAGVDTPSSSPYVTAVGGTVLRLEGDRVVDEFAWEHSGSGESKTFPTPEWQKAAVAGRSSLRCVADVALNADTRYWMFYLGKWSRSTGTSFGAPILAGLLAVVNEGRAAQGKPRLGWLNPLLYARPDVQATFRDVRAGQTTRGYAAGPGWDIPTGWGAPSAEGLLRTLP